MDNFNKSIKELRRSSRSYSSQGQDITEAAIALLKESQGVSVCCVESQTCRDDDSHNDESASDDSSLDEINIIQGKSELRKTLERLTTTADRFGESIPALGGVPLTTPRSLPLPMRSTTIEEMHNAGYPIPGCGIQAGSMLYKSILEPAELDISLGKERRKEARRKKKQLDQRKAILAEKMLIDMVVKYVDAGVCAGPCAGMDDKCVFDPEEDPNFLTADACIGGCVSSDDEDDDDSGDMDDECVGACLDYDEEPMLLLSEVCPDDCLDDADAKVDCFGACPNPEEAHGGGKRGSHASGKDGSHGSGKDGSHGLGKDGAGSLRPGEDDDDDECQVMPHEGGRECIKSCKEGGPACTMTD